MLGNDQSESGDWAIDHYKRRGVNNYREMRDLL